MPAQKMWLKRVLIPLWVLELIVLGIFFVLGCIVIAAASNIEGNSDAQTLIAGAGAIVVAITGLCILLTFIEIGLAAAHKLNPIFHLVSATIKTIIWLIYFCLTAAAAQSPLDIVLSLIVMLCSIGQLVYGSIIMHRVRKGFYSNHGAVTYEAENGYKMGSTTEAAAVPEPPQYR